MVVIPCTTNTASRISYSLGSDLPVRAADVTVKESRPLVLDQMHLEHDLVRRWAGPPTTVTNGAPR